MLKIWGRTGINFPLLKNLSSHCKKKKLYKCKEIDVVITLQYICILKVTHSCLTLCNPMDYTVHVILQARILAWVAFPSPGIEPRSPILQAASLPVEPQGKPKNTGVGSLYFLQWIFPTQESNQGLQHCRRILYQLSHQGSPCVYICVCACVCVPKHYTVHLKLTQCYMLIIFQQSCK